MIILGIDPGLHISGYAIARREGSRVILLECSYLRMSYSTPLAERVGRFGEFFTDIVRTKNITDIALETSFLGRNAQTFLKLGYLRGVLYYIASTHKITLHEFAPRQVKSAATGYGGASKDQVARMMHQLFPGLEEQEKQDVTDALAITLCGAWHINHKAFSSI